MMFIQFIIAMMLGLVCPSTTNNANSNNTTTTTTNGGGDTPDTGGDTGGDMGHVPPK